MGGVSFAIVKSKARLGQLVGKKTASCVAFTSVAKEFSKDLDTLNESVNTTFLNDKDHMKKWVVVFQVENRNTLSTREQLCCRKNLRKKVECKYMLMREIEYK